MKSILRALVVALFLCIMSMSIVYAEGDLSYLERVVVEKGIDMVSITLPPEMVEDEDVWEGSILPVMNDDGGQTLFLTYGEFDEFLNMMREDLKKTLCEMVEDETYEYVSVEANKDFTNYIITVDGEKLSLGGTFGVFGLQMCSYLYSIFSGESFETISFTVINKNTGETVSSFTNTDFVEGVVQ